MRRSPRVTARNQIPRAPRFTGRARGVTCTPCWAVGAVIQTRFRMSGCPELCPEYTRNYTRNYTRTAQKEARISDRCGEMVGTLRVGMSGGPVVRRCGGPPGCSGMSGGPVVRRCGGPRDCSGMVGDPTDAANRWAPYGLGCPAVQWCGGPPGCSGMSGDPTFRSASDGMGTGPTLRVRCAAGRCGERNGKRNGTPCRTRHDSRAAPAASPARHVGSDCGDTEPTPGGPVRPGT